MPVEYPPTRWSSASEMEKRSAASRMRSGMSSRGTSNSSAA